MSAAKKSTTATTPVTEDPQVVEPDEVVQDEILDAELERLLPDFEGPLTLEDGTKVVIRPLKLKELFAAFKIITRGAAMSMGALSFSMLEENKDHFAETLIALLINAIPEADQEACEFLRIIVDPLEPEGGWKDRDERAEAEAHLDEILLVDPDISDAIDIISAVIHHESKDIQRLGKKVGNAVKMFSKVTPKTSKN